MKSTKTQIRIPSYILKFLDYISEKYGINRNPYIIMSLKNEIEKSSIEEILNFKIKNITSQITDAKQITSFLKININEVIENNEFGKEILKTSILNFHTSPFFMNELRNMAESTGMKLGPFIRKCLLFLFNKEQRRELTNE